MEDDLFALALPALHTLASEHETQEERQTFSSQHQSLEQQRPRKKRQRQQGEDESDGTDSYQPREIRCRDCKQTFVFTAREQRDLAKLGFTGDARSRCDACKNYKKNRFGARAVVDDAAGGAAQGRMKAGKGKGKGKGKGAGDQGSGKGKGAGDPAAAGPRRRNLCDAFQKGACNRGSSCKYMHILERYTHMIDWRDPGAG